MIGPISFLWKQLNGPQITAFTKSVYNWAVDEFDRSLEYLNNLSISTANSKHLSFLGMLANFSRPFNCFHKNDIGPIICFLLSKYYLP